MATRTLEETFTESAQTSKVSEEGKERLVEVAFLQEYMDESNKVPLATLSLEFVHLCQSYMVWMMILNYNAPILTV